MKPGGPRVRAEAGMTLVELMVAILLAAILTAGLFYMMSGQSRTYTAQVKTMGLQQNLWGAMEYIQRQVRMAGYGFGGCPLSADSRWPSPVVQAWDASKGSVAESSIVAVAVFNGCNLLAYKGSYPPPASCKAGPGDDSLAIAIASGDAIGGLAGVRLTKQMRDTDDSCTVAVAGSFATGDLAVLWEVGSTGKRCLLQKVTGVTATAPATIAFAPDGVYNVASPLDMPSGGYANGSLLIRYRAAGESPEPMKFAIDHSVDPPRLVQWVKPDRSDLEVVADGIEDMQVAWACDTAGGALAGVLEEGATETAKRSDEWAYNVATDTLPACGSNAMAAVRITLIARAASPEAGEKGPAGGVRGGFRPAAEDRPAGTVADDLAASGGLGTYRRAKLTVQVRPRNTGN